MTLLIDNYDSFTYNLYQMVSSLGEKVVVVRNDKISLEEILRQNPARIILSPGPGRPEEAGICMELLLHLLKKKMHLPLLGVCLGHQAIGIALGSNIISAPEIVHERSDFVFHHRQGLYQKLPLSFQAGRYHSLAVNRSSLAPELVVEAENGSGLIMGIRHRELPIYGVQFHPESILRSRGARCWKVSSRKEKENHEAKICH